MYLNALRKNDRTVIEEYESFGDNPRQLLMNRREYDRHLLFGFTRKAFNECGWLERPDFLECEKIQFPHRDGWAVSNYITLGRGLNSKWTYEISYSCSTGGSCYGSGVWGKPFDSRKECLTEALNEFRVRLAKDSSPTNKYSTVLKQAKSLYDEITGRKEVKLALSFFLIINTCSVVYQYI